MTTAVAVRPGVRIGPAGVPPRRMRLFVTRNTGEEPAPENVTPMQKYERDLGS